MYVHDLNEWHKKERMDLLAQKAQLPYTPSTLKLPAGDHKTRLEKSGFKNWERTLTVSAGTAATINPTLDKE